MAPATSPKAALNWREHAIAAEAARDLPAALDAWQNALAQEPDALDIVAHIAGLAARLTQWPLAEKLYAHLIRCGQQQTAVLKAYAETLREQSRFDEAVDLLKSLLAQHPQEAALWEVLGTVMVARGEAETALVFFDEALRLSPDSVSTRFERACARMDKGDLRGGMTDAIDCARRFRDPRDRLTAELCAGYAAIALGDLENGWRWYEARHKRGTQAEVRYDIDLPPLSGDVKGQRVFISAEQGLGDEVLFGSLLPDIAAEAAHIGIGVEPRLVPLFQRAFPQARVVAHRTRTLDGRVVRDFPDLAAGEFDSWARMGDFLKDFRPKADAFPKRRGFLRADPARVAHWADWLKHLDGHPKVGLLWKSIKRGVQRDRYFSPFGHWKQLLKTQGVTFINLQYGDSSAEQAEAKAEGLNFVTPSGIDLKADLDDVAALSSALDLLISTSNATSNIAAACGVEAWIIANPNFWLRMGQPDFPWYPSVRVFETDSLSDWYGVFDRVSEALGTYART